MRVFFCDHVEVPLPPGHRFPMAKYARLRERLLSALLLDPTDLQPSTPASITDLARVHAPHYLEGLLSGTLDPRILRAIGFPWSDALVRRSRASVSGTLCAGRAALEDGISGNLAGGTHHAFADRGAGFCVFNDIAVACRTLLDAGDVRRVLVLDLDVHQGDGTASLFGNEPRVYTASIHGEKNFPFHKQQSDLDLALPDQTGDDEYLAALEPFLARAFAESNPDLVFFQGGVDALAADKLGRLGMTAAGMRRRDERVLGEARRRGIPIALTLGGGYTDPIDATLAAHVGTYAVAREVFG
ncbi:histone deacetylase family protein [Polyangium mundeleinium]|uniref:Histone deacetylase n=1 Tax=Polyangium mundeleinium TaxID=2995306 RepID=A0ABT5EHE0_9BACT|nr:histone deacetylase [Polyangium mundeleinium]MDC0741241.1 histone deacetylase [Polyangium mundeleinium]